ncbi:MAG: hypothetical protein GX594_15580 [Pirellulaceae bacterium]|nr:hypothetical protein [Pirellulaceae bacterium]
MNYFAHAQPFLDRPQFVAGACLPDWLAVADRRLRLRPRHAEAFLDDPDRDTAELAAGVLQHLRDDALFHATRTFAETSLELSVRTRDALGKDGGMRPFFLGHLLVELLLDAALIDDDPSRLTEYYRLLDGLDAGRIEAAVNRMAPRPTRRLADFIELFRRERVLWDYLEDETLVLRLNQIMRRVRLEPLPGGFAAILPEARKLVTARKTGLLEGIRKLTTEN